MDSLEPLDSAFALESVRDEIESLETQAVGLELAQALEDLVSLEATTRSLNRVCIALEALHDDLPPDAMEGIAGMVDAAWTPLESYGIYPAFSLEANTNNYIQKAFQMTYQAVKKLLGLLISLLGKMTTFTKSIFVGTTASINRSKRVTDEAMDRLKGVDPSQDLSVKASKSARAIVGAKGDMLMGYIGTGLVDIKDIMATAALVKAGLATGQTLSDQGGMAAVQKLLDAVHAIKLESFATEEDGSTIKLTPKTKLEWWHQSFLVFTFPEEAPKDLKGTVDAYAALTKNAQLDHFQGTAPSMPAGGEPISLTVADALVTLKTIRGFLDRADEWTRALKRTFNDLETQISKAKDAMQHLVDQTANASVAKGDDQAKAQHALAFQRTSVTFSTGLLMGKFLGLFNTQSSDIKSVAQASRELAGALGGASKQSAKQTAKSA